MLRPPHQDDIPELAVLANNRRVAEMLARMPHPYGEAEARAFVQSTRGARGVRAASMRSRLPTPAPSSAAPGSTRAADGLELGYWIGEPYWRHGYATEAAHALVDLAFRATAIEALNVSCRVINDASRRVIHKCGFQYAGQGMMNSICAGTGADRALPARPQDLGQPAELGLS